MALVGMDWNGTLLDDTLGWAQASNAALGVLGIAPQPLNVLQDAYDTPTCQTIFNLGVSQATYDAHAAAMYVAFKQTLDATTADAPLREGAREMLDTLKADGHEVILLSNHPQDELEVELGRVGLRGVFVHVSGRQSLEQIRTQTTKSDRLAQYMKMHGYYPHETVVVGDAREEARIARALGASSICVSGGYSSRRALVQDGAHYVVDSLLEVPFIMRALKL